MADKEFVFGINIDTKDASKNVKATTSQLKTMSQAIEMIERH
jgi:hypothetical protein